MVKKMLDAITEALHAEFGSEYRIYTEDVPQGLRPPCFLVTTIMPIRDKETYVTYRQRALFVVQYFPAVELSERNEIHNVISRLDDCLEVVTVTWGDEETKKTRTQVTDVAIVDGVLSYTVMIQDVYFWLFNGDDMEAAEIEVKHG